MGVAFVGTNLFLYEVEKFLYAAISPLQLELLTDLILENTCLSCSAVILHLPFSTPKLIKKQCLLLAVNQGTSILYFIFSSPPQNPFNALEMSFRKLLEEHKDYYFNL